MGCLALGWGCGDDEDSYAKLHGLGNYAIFSHSRANGACDSTLIDVPDTRCIGLVPQTDGIWLQDCIDAEQDSLGFDVELSGTAPTYAAIRHDPELCEETCVGAQSDQCTDVCLANRSCVMKTEVFTATLDTRARTLHVALDEYTAEFELEPGAYCTDAMANDFRNNAQCIQRDVYDARWTGK
jgi:hypothetical protein